MANEDQSLQQLALGMRSQIALSMTCIPPRETLHSVPIRTACQ